MCKSTALALLLIFAFAAHSLAADETDACGAVLCLTGEMNGNGDGGTSCKPYVKRYFGIQIFKKGEFKPNATSAARQNWLSGCQSADPSTISAITSAFGKELL